MANPNWFKGMKSPNPKGRPSGSKNEETKKFLLSVFKEWAKHKEHPLAFTVNSLLDGTHPVYEEEGITGRDKLNSIHRMTEFIGKHIIDSSFETQLVEALSDRTDEDLDKRIEELEEILK
ncbi:hypothetical protein C4G51_RS18610 [Vibrio parahaemolyticus]|nr:hypothetical protein [Vibrio parahaemolyticus]